MIVKEQFPGQSWNSQGIWHGPFRNRISLEGYLHGLADKGHPSVIKFLGDHVNLKLKIIRIYTEYAELGNLFTLVRNHARMQQIADENGRPLSSKFTRIPAVAVFCICEAMAASVCLMAHGQVPDDQGQWAPGCGNGDGPNPPWPHNIIHQDIKSANFFLSKCKDPTTWRELPMARLGDFGNGFDARDQWWIAHPKFQVGMGTTNPQAPEQVPGSGVPGPLSSATNVFQVGLVMYELMTSSHPNQQMTLLAPKLPFPPLDNRAYPRALVDLANECLRVAPAERPSPKDFYMRMRTMVTELPQSPQPRPSHQRPWSKLPLEFDLWRDFQ
jgi:serine/threonine protein kinase